MVNKFIYQIYGKFIHLLLINQMKRLTKIEKNDPPYSHIRTISEAMPAKTKSLFQKWILNIPISFVVNK